MPDSSNTQLAPFIERARKVLQYEQRGNHQDRVVNGGLELFVVRWADEVSAVCKKAGLDLKPIYRFTEHLEGYRRQDPMQRAASLRMAISILNELENNGEGNNTGSPSRAGNPGKVSPPLGRPPAPTRLANAAGGLEMRPVNAAAQLPAVRQDARRRLREKGKFWGNPRPRQRATPSALLCYKWMSVEMPCKSQTLMV